jgi:hypothetical protein
MHRKNRNNRPFSATRATALKPVLHAAVLGLTLATPLTQAQAPTSQPQEPFRLEGSLAVGAEHNNNLSIAQLESASGQSDTALTVEGNINALWQASDKLSLESGYSYSMSRYQDIDSFDLDLHLMFADMAYDFGKFTLGGNYYYAMADLGGDSFLDLDQYSLYAGKLFGQEWYLRGALNFVDKDFAAFNQRDADNEGFSVDLYRFFNQGKSSVTLSYAYEQEDTRGPSFTYDANTLRLRLSHRFLLAERNAQFQMGMRLQDRDYPNPTPSIGVPRDDSQRVADVRLEVNLVESLSLVTRWEYGDYQSRLDTATFTDNRVSVQLKFTF